jgi:hypothetical protein
MKLRYEFYKHGKISLALLTKQVNDSELGRNVPVSMKRDFIPPFALQRGIKGDFR